MNPRCENHSPCCNTTAEEGKRNSQGALVGCLPARVITSVAPKPVLLHARGAGRAKWPNTMYQSVSSQCVDQQIALCLCDGDWWAQPPLPGEETVSVPSNWNARKVFTVKVGNIYLLKAAFIMMNTGGASSKGQKNCVHYTQARYHLLFFKFQINNFEAVIFTFTIWSF